MKLFEDVVPLHLKCPACGVVSISNTYSNKEAWKLVNKNIDTLFLNTKCGHNFLLSKTILSDKNGLPMGCMNKQKLGTVRYYTLRTYKIMLDSKDWITDSIENIKRLLFPC
ncbi:MAG: hypothetical protein ABSB71_07745 [Candidatus Bathyarchaeia archaeon]|jgi:hypothetical protein